MSQEQDDTRREVNLAISKLHEAITLLHHAADRILGCKQVTDHLEWARDEVQSAEKAILRAELFSSAFDKRQP